MKIKNRYTKYSIVISIVVVLFMSIWGVPVKGMKTAVKANRTNVNGTFTGTWSLIKGKEGTFMADEGWTFEGIINPDGGLRKGELTDFPILSEGKTYTGSVEDNVLTDVKRK